MTRREQRGAAPEPRWEARFVAEMVAERERQGLSQSELARRVSAGGLRMQPPTIWRIEEGERPVRLNEAVLIADALGINLPDLVRSDQENWRRYFTGTLEWQHRHYSAIVEGTKDLVRLQDFAWDQVAAAGRSEDARQDEEVGGLVEETVAYMDSHTPWIAVRHGLRTARVILAQDGDFERWALEEQLLDGLRRALEEAREEQEAVDLVNGLFIVIAEATARLDYLLASPAHDGRAETASADQAVLAGHERDLSEESSSVLASWERNMLRELGSPDSGSGG